MNSVMCGVTSTEMYMSTLIFFSHILFNVRIVLEDPMLLKIREKSLNVRKITLFNYNIGCIGRAGIIVKS